DVCVSTAFMAVLLLPPAPAPAVDAVTPRPGIKPMADWRGELSSVEPRPGSNSRPMHGAKSALPLEAPAALVGRPFAPARERRSMRDDENSPQGDAPRPPGAGAGGRGATWSRPILDEGPRQASILRTTLDPTAASGCRLGEGSGPAPPAA